MKLPDSVVPLLKQVASKHKLPLELWEAENGHRIMDAFFELAAELERSDLEADRLPKGYLILSLLFCWESACQFEAWNAFAWQRDQLGAILEAFDTVGLQSEAAALKLAHAAWQRNKEDHAGIVEAYCSVQGNLGESERLEYLTDYFCSHAAELFYEP
jgi:hypothetical protein